MAVLNPLLTRLVLTPCNRLHVAASGALYIMYNVKLSAAFRRRGISTRVTDDLSQPAHCMRSSMDTYESQMHSSTTTFTSPEIMTSSSHLSTDERPQVELLATGCSRVNSSGDNCQEQASQGDSAAQLSSRDTPTTMWRMLSYMSASREFWFAVSGNTFLSAVKLAGQGLTAFYLRDSAEQGLVQDSTSILLAASFSAGVGFGVLAFGHLFTRAGKANKVRIVNWLNALSILALTIISIDARSTATTFHHVVIRALMIFISALGIGLCFYIPPGLFAIRFGGENAGVVSAFLDGLGYLGTAGISTLIRSIQAANQESPGQGWSMVWLLCVVLYIAGAICTTCYLSPLLASKEGEVA